METKTNLISTVTCDFKKSLKNFNDSSFDQLEFRSLESNSFKTNTKAHETIKNNSYSEVVKAFIQKLNERRTKDEKKITKIASSTPFKKFEMKNSLNISGIAYLDFQKKIEESLNDSDFESMDQDQYDDTKENIIVEDKSNAHEIIKCIKIESSSKKKKISLTPTGSKFKKNYSPYKKKRNLSKLKLSMIENSSLITNNESLLFDNNESASFAFSQPNKTQSFEASIKNLTQLSVSISLRTVTYAIFTYFSHREKETVLTTFHSQHLKYIPKLTRNECSTISCEKKDAPEVSEKSEKK